MLIEGAYTESSTDQDRQDVSVQSLESILRIETVRKLFWSFENGVGVQRFVSWVYSLGLLLCWWLTNGETVW